MMIKNSYLSSKGKDVKENVFQCKCASKAKTEWIAEIVKIPEDDIRA